MGKIHFAFCCVVLLISSLSFAVDAATVVWQENYDGSGYKVYDGTLVEYGPDYVAFKEDYTQQTSGVLDCPVDDLVVMEGDLCKYRFKTRSFPINQYCAVILRLYINGNEYAVSDTYETITEENTFFEREYVIPVTGTLSSAQLLVQYSGGTIIEAHEMSIVRDCKSESYLWSDDLENYDSSRSLVNSALLEDGAGFMKLQANAAPAEFKTSIASGVNVESGDLFLFEFKIDDFGSHETAVVGITYNIDGLEYYNTGREYSDPNTHRGVFEIAESGVLSGVDFVFNYCDDGQFSVYDYQVKRMTPCIKLQGDFDLNYEVNGDDLSSMASKWLDNSSGTIHNDCSEWDSKEFAAWSCNHETLADGPWGNYFRYYGEGQTGWTGGWFPRQGDGFLIAAGDELYFNAKGLAADFMVGMKIAPLNDTSASGNYYWPHDETRNYNYDGDHWTYLSDEWTEFKLEAPATGLLKAVEFTVYSPANEVSVDNFRVVREDVVMKLDDDMQNAIDNRTYTNLDYSDEDGYISLVVGDTFEEGSMVTDANSLDIQIAEGEIMTYNFDVTSLAGNPSLNVQLIATIDEVNYSSANIAYNELASFKVDFLIPASGKLNGYAVRLNSTTSGASIDSHRCYIDPVPMEYLVEDVNQDRLVNLKDLSMLAENWLVCSRPDCQ